MKQALMLPLGEADFKRGIRPSFMTSVEPILAELGLGIGYELKGNEIDPDGWIKELHEKQPEAQLCWHPGAGIAKTLGNQDEPIPPALKKAALQAGALHTRYGLTLFTIHLAPAMTTEPTAGAGIERYNSPITAEEMLEHIRRQIDPLGFLADLSRETLSIETVDTCNFVDAGHKLPTYLALQTGAGRELKAIQNEVKTRTGFHINITVDPEHVLCSANVFQRRKDMKEVPYSEPANPSKAMLELAELTGYWLEKGKAPYSAVGFESTEGNDRNALKLFNPELLHLGAAEQAETDMHEIGTHLPYNPWDNWQMGLLDEILEWSFQHQGNSRGWVIEVTGRKVSERYSRWSPRPEDDEIAKLMSLLVVIDRLKAIYA